MDAWKWAWEAAQTASPPVCVLETIAIYALWRQLLFERKEHRKTENGFTGATIKVAKALEKMVGAMNRGGTGRRER